MRHARSLGDWERQIKELESENQALRAGKDEAEQTLDAIRRGEVDALIVNTPEGQRLFTLEGAERPYRALIEQMQQGAATLSQDGTIHYANRAFANMLNRPLETLIGTRMEPCIQGPDRPAFAAMLGECGPGGTHREVSLCAKPGGVLPVLLSLSRVGQAVAGDIYMMVVTNLSERKQTEQVLASAKFAWAILAQAEGAIMVFDPGRRLAFANSAARRLAGLDPAGSDLNFGEEAWGRQCYPDNRPMPAEEHALERALRGERTVALECRMVRADGSHFDILVSGTPLQDEQGKVIGAVCMFTDITERKRAEAALRESEERFRVMANAIPQLAWIARADGYIFWYNQRWHDYTGTTSEQMEGWGWQSVHDENELPKVLDRWRASIATGEPFDMTFPLRGADGIFRPFLTRVLPMKDAEGRVLQWFGTNTDITERKRMEERLAAAKQSAESHARQLEAANKEMETFSYSVSHDLRAPLRSIDAFSRILLEEYLSQLPAKAQEYLRFVSDGARQMGRLIDDLLNFSRLGHQPIQPQPLAMDAIVHEVVDALAPEREGRKVQVQIGELPPCVADPVLLRVIWQNLLSNAVKFSRRSDPAVIEIGSRRDDGGGVVYFIKDNGVGFDMRYADKLFVVFQRLHRAEEFEGTGIGLATVQRIIHRHGGRIWGEAQVDRGATFSFTLGEGVPS